MVSSPFSPCTDGMCSDLFHHGTQVTPLPAKETKITWYQQHNPDIQTLSLLSMIYTLH